MTRRTAPQARPPLGPRASPANCSAVHFQAELNCTAHGLTGGNYHRQTGIIDMEVTAREGCERSTLGTPEKMMGRLDFAIRFCSCARPPPASYSQLSVQTTTVYKPRAIVWHTPFALRSFALLGCCHRGPRSSHVPPESARAACLDRAHRARTSAGAHIAYVSSLTRICALAAGSLFCFAPVGVRPLSVLEVRRSCQSVCRATI